MTVDARLGESLFREFQRSCCVVVFSRCCGWALPQPGSVCAVAPMFAKKQLRTNRIRGRVLNQIPQPIIHKAIDHEMNSIGGPVIRHAVR